MNRPFRHLARLVTVIAFFALASPSAHAERGNRGYGVVMNSQSVYWQQEGKNYTEQVAFRALAGGPKQVLLTTKHEVLGVQVTDKHAFVALDVPGSLFSLEDTVFTVPIAGGNLTRVIAPTLPDGLSKGCGLGLQDLRTGVLLTEEYMSRACGDPFTGYRRSARLLTDIDTVFWTEDSLMMGALDELGAHSSSPTQLVFGDQWGASVWTGTSSRVIDRAPGSRLNGVSARADGSVLVNETGQEKSTSVKLIRPDGTVNKLFEYRKGQFREVVFCGDQIVDLQYGGSEQDWGIRRINVRSTEGAVERVIWRNPKKEGGESFDCNADFIAAGGHYYEPRVFSLR